MEGKKEVKRAGRGIIAINRKQCKNWMRARTPGGIPAFLPPATKMFQFARLSLVCPWIQQQFERLTYSGISGSTLIFNSPKHFVAYYALPRLWVPRMWGLGLFLENKSHELKPSRT
ncbi:hypothetical protein V6N11_045630 [Hibiscus sabdariffa]|uniref:Uncharacterized protein n=1 Tax=Hibiscus sabdariffa TaxID=183260 RepID=A0ABR2Q1M9_9ROSI